LSLFPSLIVSLFIIIITFPLLLFFSLSSFPCPLPPPPPPLPLLFSSFLIHRCQFVARRSFASIPKGEGKVKLAPAPCIGFNLDDDQREYMELARKFTREEIVPKAAHHDETGEYPHDILKKVMFICIFIFYISLYLHIQQLIVVLC
jgi:hypothetical protein